AKALPPGQKRHNASDITRAGKAERISISSLRAVAAATGRGFKSNKPIQRAEEVYRCLCQAPKSNRQAFGTNASTTHGRPKFSCADAFLRRDCRGTDRFRDFVVWAKTVL